MRARRLPDFMVASVVFFRLAEAAGLAAPLPLRECSDEDVFAAIRLGLRVGLTACGELFPGAATASDWTIARLTSRT
jgi:hypothetical protein